jgi:hypothetical protein
VEIRPGDIVFKAGTAAGFQLSFASYGNTLLSSDIVIKMANTVPLIYNLLIGFHKMMTFCNCI